MTENAETLANWKLTGKLLNLSEQELLVIEAKYLMKDSLKECFYQMLLKWRLKEPENCYLEYLCKKLKINMNKFLSSDESEEETKKRFDCYFKKYFQKFEENFLKFKNVSILFLIFEDFFFFF